ncbi:hypothetical protein LDENG_00211480 [Lucifuga dentata]|nr:hypothetical protein LDENG_00211480 [Lucifuga dentata]
MVKQEITSALEPVEQKLASHGTTTGELEQSANDHNTQLAKLQAKVDALLVMADSLTKKYEDLETCSRWNNIRLVGPPEDTKGPRPTEFVAQLLQDLLGLTEKPVLDWAHRILRSKPRDGEPTFFK